MINFVYDNKTKIVFGKDTEKQVGAITKQYGKKVLLHYGKESIKKYGLYDTVIQSLKENDIEFVELGGVKANPVLSLVEEGIRLTRNEQVDFILAVGGGSVIDSAKAIALGHYYDGNVWDFYETGIRPKKVLPIATVLTIPAAGSESSTATVITNEEKQLKRGYGDLSLRPVFSIMNPELTYTLPNYQTACGVVDMIGHVIERYFTNTKDVDLTDRLCESVITTVMHHAPIVLKDNLNYASRSEIMWAGALAHNGLVGTGREEDWASHGIEHQLSALYDLAHGAGLAIIFPAWMKYVYKHDLDRFSLWANKIFNVQINPENLEETALQGIHKLEEFYQSIGMPIRMSEAGIDASDIPLMAKKALGKNKTIGNFVKLNYDDIVNIYHLAK